VKGGKNVPKSREKEREREREREKERERERERHTISPREGEIERGRKVFDA
jgi:hypothetical protein